MPMGSVMAPPVAVVSMVIFLRRVQLLFHHACGGAGRTEDER